MKLIKDSDEIKRMVEAGKWADKALEIGFNSIKEGISEEDIVAEIEYQLKKQGVKVWVIVIVTLFVIGLIGSLSDNISSNQTNNISSNITITESTQSSTSNNKPTETFTISDVNAEEDLLSYYITGIIVNNTNKDKSYVQVTFNLYDEDGNQVGTAIDSINNLKANGSWKFKAIALVEKEQIYGYELSEITSF